MPELCRFFVRRTNGQCSYEIIRSSHALADNKRFTFGATSWWCKRGITSNDVTDYGSNDR